MPTLQDRLEDATAQVEADAQILRDIVQGSSSTEVETEGGKVKSCAKAIADMEAEWNAPNGVAKARAILDEIKTKLEEATQHITQARALEETVNALREELTQALEAARLDQSAAWAEVTDKPDMFPPESHTHPIQQITGITISPDEPPSNVGENGDIWIRTSR